jgi:hypothetical protein
MSELITNVTLETGETRRCAVEYAFDHDATEIIDVWDVRTDGHLTSFVPRDEMDRLTQRAIEHESEARYIALTRTWY